MNLYDNINSLSGGQLPPIPFKGGDKGFSWDDVPHLPKIPTKLSDLPSGLSALQSGLSNLPDGWSNLPRALTKWPGGLSNLPGGISNLPNLPPFVSGRLPEGLRGSYKFANRLLKGDVIGPPGFHPGRTAFPKILIVELGLGERRAGMTTNGWAPVPQEEEECRCATAAELMAYGVTPTFKPKYRKERKAQTFARKARQRECESYGIHPAHIIIDREHLTITKHGCMKSRWFFRGIVSFEE